MQKNNDKILIAFDGSRKAFKTIEYLCRFKPFHDKKIVLLNIISSVPDCYYDIKKDPSSNRALSQVRAWEYGHRAEMEGFMDEARMMLITSGYKSKNITISIKKKKNGVARDILAEAQNQCHALVLRRRGWAASLLPIPLGSISTKLVAQATATPVILAGLKENTNSVLIAIDGSDGSQRAIQFLASTIGKFDYNIVLLSVVRDCGTESESKETGKDVDFTKLAFEEFELSLKKATGILKNAGVDPAKITTKIVQEAKSRALAIIEAAKQEDCDTIIFGRKGKTDVASYGIGRVPWKVIHGYREITVWIVP